MTYVLRDQWITYAKAVDMLGSDVSETQLRETQKAFYAGAMGLMKCLNDLADSDYDPDSEHGAAQLDHLFDELNAFSRNVLAEGK